MSKKHEKKFKDAVWQYIVDHASVADDKMYRITFHVYSSDDFWQRVKARRTGQYIRKDQVEFEKRAELIRKRREKHGLILKKRTKRLNALYHGDSVDRARARLVTKLLKLADELLYEI